MGSYCVLKFDAIEVVTAKSAIPEIFASLFQENDCQLRAFEDDDEEEQREEVWYAGSRATVLDRLDFLGFTAVTAERAFAEWHENELEAE